MMLRWLLLLDLVLFANFRPSNHNGHVVLGALDAPLACGRGIIYRLSCIVW